MLRGLWNSPRKGICFRNFLSETHPKNSPNIRSLESIEASWSLLPCHFALRQVISTRTGISFFTGIVNSEGGSILKSDSGTGLFLKFDLVPRRFMS